MTASQPPAKPSNWNVPNVLTALRVVMVPLFAWLLLAQPNDPMLVSDFEIRIGEQKAISTLCMPIATIQPILDALAVKPEKELTGSQALAADHLKGRMEEVPLSVTAQVLSGRVDPRTTMRAGSMTRGAGAAPPIMATSSSAAAPGVSASTAASRCCLKLSFLALSCFLTAARSFFQALSWASFLLVTAA